MDNYVSQIKSSKIYPELLEVATEYLTATVKNHFSEDYKPQTQNIEKIMGLLDKAGIPLKEVNGEQINRILESIVHQSFMGRKR